MTLLTIFLGIIALSNLLLMTTIAMLAFSLKKLMDTSVTSTISDVNSAVRNVNDMVDKIETRVEHIMQIGEQTARQVSGKVVAATDVVEHSVTVPMVGISSILAGINRALEVWRSATVKP